MVKAEENRELEVRHWYMEVHMEVAKEDLSCDLTADLVQVMMRAAVNEMFGETTSSLPMDILKYNVDSGVCVVRVPASSYSKVRAALTVCGNAVVADQSVKVSYRVKQASGCLLSLAGPTRCIT